MLFTKAHEEAKAGMEAHMANERKRHDAELREATAIAKFIRVKCECLDGDGTHLIDLYSAVWNDSRLGFYECNTCGLPLVCRDKNGKFYYVGERI